MACEHLHPSALCQGCTWCAHEIGVAAERARIIARIREEAAPGSLHPATSTILLGMADLLESEEKP